MQMRAIQACFVLVVLGGCTAAVSDLNGFTNSTDACDPRGTQHLGEDLDIQFFNTNAHINQDIRFAVEVGPDRSIEAMFVVSAFDDPNLLLHVPGVLPAAPATLAFWADSNLTPGFQALSVDPSMQPDHQWFRPICPNGQMTFTHTTPFQDIQDATSTGAVFRFEIPVSFQRPELFDHRRMAAWAVLVDDAGRQTRAFYRWAPFVALSPGMPVPAQRPPPAFFQVGGNVLGEMRGTIDSGSIYEIHFVIDADDDDDFGTTGDYNCVWMNQAMPTGAGTDPNLWDYVPDLSACDPNGFDPVTFTP